MYRCMVAVESASPRIQKVMKKRLKIDKVRKIVDFIAGLDPAITTRED